MRLTMQERRTVTKAYSAGYRRARKKEKGRILDEFTESTGYNRVYAARLLRNHGRRVEVRPGIVLEGKAGQKCPRKRDREYGPEVLPPLKEVWKVMDYICGKRLAPMLSEVVPCLVRWKELKASRAAQAKLVKLSASTIDRLLAAERKKQTLKGRGQTKPGTLLKHQIPVRTFSQWDDAVAGFMQMDLVGHDGGSTAGEYCQTLDMLDVATQWSELVAAPTKAQCRVFEAIREVRDRLPFNLLGLDSDNGSEFINDQLTRYCAREEITFTRGRAGRKNDHCFIEQKNWSVLRRYVGYPRFEGEEACRLLNELYAVVRDYVNFFMPSAKLIEKVRDGARVIKRHDKAQTPYQRVLASPDIPQAVKRRLRKRYVTLNPAQLKREMQRLQKALMKQTVRLHDETIQYRKPAANHPWRRAATKRKTG